MLQRFKILYLLWGLLKHHKVQFLLCLFFVFLNSILLGGILSFLMPVINQFFALDTVVTKTNNGYFGKILNIYQSIIRDFEYKELIAIGVLFLMMIVNSTVKFLIIYVNSGLMANMTYEFRRQIYWIIQKLRFVEVSTEAKGTFIQLIITETKSINNLFKHGLLLITATVNACIIALLLMLLSWKMCVGLLLGYLVVLYINSYIIRGIKILGKEALNLRSELANHITEGIWGLKQLKIIQAEALEKQKINQVSFRSEFKARTLVVKNGLLKFTSQSLSTILVFIIFVLWFYFPVLSEDIPRKAGFLTFLILLSRLAPHVNAISSNYGQLSSILPSILRLHEFYTKELEPEQSGSLKPEPFLQEEIHLQNVEFGYLDDKPILKGINLKIQKGAYIGIVGNSGGGKSTLLNLFPRLYAPDKGKILIDNVNVEEFDLSYLRAKIGIISQDFVLFNTTIRENLALGKPQASEEELWQALEKSGLQQFVQAQEDGLDYQVGNNGSKLSGGQRQRLSLASLFLQDLELIILDEGTSSVDPETERHILNSLQELHKKGITIISIAHKESALADAECIYELSEGHLQLKSPAV